MDWGAFLACSVVRLDDTPEFFRANLWDELHVSKGVIVAKVSIEATDIGNEFLVIELGEAID